MANPLGNDANCHRDRAGGISDLKMEKQNKVRANVRQLPLGVTPCLTMPDMRLVFICHFHFVDR